MEEIKKNSVDNDQETKREGEFEYTSEEILDAIKQVKESSYPESLKKILIAALQTVINVNIILQKKNIAIARLRKLFGFKSEKKSLKKMQLPKIRKRAHKALRRIMSKK